VIAGREATGTMTYRPAAARTTVCPSINDAPTRGTPRKRVLLASRHSLQRGFEVGVLDHRHPPASTASAR